MKTKAIIIIFLLLVIVGLISALVYPKETIDNFKPLYYLIKDLTYTIFIKPIIPLYNLLTNYTNESIRGGN